MRKLVMLSVLAALTGCADHPVDCAVGISLYDGYCRPGTAGYERQHPGWQQQQQRQEEQAAAFKAGVAQCKIDHPPVVGNYVAESQCVNDVAEQVGWNSPSNNVLKALRMSLAEKVDAHQMSISDAKLQLASAGYELDQRDAQANAQINSANSQAESARMQGAAARIQASTAFMNALPKPVYTPIQPIQSFPQPVYQPRTWNTTCNRVGEFTHCNGTEN